MTGIKTIDSLHALRWGWALLFSIGMSAAAHTSTAATPLPHTLRSWTQMTHRIIVHYRNAPAATLQSNSVMQKLSTEALVPLTYRRMTANGSHVLRLPKDMTVNDAQQVAQRLARDPNVLYAQPSYVMHVDALPNDPLFHEQWALGNTGGGIDMEQAWNITQGSPDIVMAVLDTGILKNHPEFQGRLLPGYNFISDPSTAGNGIGRPGRPGGLLQPRRI